MITTEKDTHIIIVLLKVLQILIDNVFGKIKMRNEYEVD